MSTYGQSVRFRHLAIVAVDDDITEYLMQLLREQRGPVSDRRLLLWCCSTLRICERMIASPVFELLDPDLPSAPH